ncbi:trehalase-like, partial [Acyrthosiphon pisum]|uniref:Alpha,alpha-trehalase n=1 Tax=Acyrthosiphon pisum TaxID=7029 RepID=A0A8R2D259_ACYPI
FYSELKAAAEFGWDFSSRRLILSGTHKGNTLNSKTSSIVPADLYALLRVTDVPTRSYGGRRLVARLQYVK